MEATNIILFVMISFILLIAFLFFYIPFSMLSKKNAYKKKNKLSEAAKEDFERFYKQLQESEYKEGENEYENAIDIIKWIHPEVTSINPGGEAIYNDSLKDKVKDNPGNIEWADVKKELLNQRQLKREFYDYSELDCSDKGKELLDDYFNSGFGIFGKATLGTDSIVGDNISIYSVYTYNDITVSMLRFKVRPSYNNRGSFQIFPFVVINKRLSKDFTFQSEFDKDGVLAHIYNKYEMTFEASGNHNKIYLRFFLEDFNNYYALSIGTLTSKKKIRNFYVAMNIILNICNDIEKINF